MFKQKGIPTWDSIPLNTEYFVEHNPFIRLSQYMTILFSKIQPLQKWPIISYWSRSSKWQEPDFDYSDPQDDILLKSPPRTLKPGCIFPSQLSPRISVEVGNNEDKVMNTTISCTLMHILWLHFTMTYSHTFHNNIESTNSCDMSQSRGWFYVRKWSCYAGMQVTQQCLNLFSSEIALYRTNFGGQNFSSTDNIFGGQNSRH